MDNFVLCTPPVVFLSLMDYFEANSRWTVSCKNIFVFISKGILFSRNHRLTEMKKWTVIPFYPKCPVSVPFPLKFHWQVLQLICLLEWGSKWGPCLLIDNNFSPSAISLLKPPRGLWSLTFPYFLGFFWLHHWAETRSLLIRNISSFFLTRKQPHEWKEIAWLEICKRRS